MQPLHFVDGPPLSLDQQLCGNGQHEVLHPILGVHASVLYAYHLLLTLLFIWQASRLRWNDPYCLAALLTCSRCLYPIYRCHSLLRYHFRGVFRHHSSRHSSDCLYRKQPYSMHSSLMGRNRSYEKLPSKYNSRSKSEVFSAWTVLRVVTFMEETAIFISTGLCQRLPCTRILRGMLNSLSIQRENAGMATNLNAWCTLHRFVQQTGGNDYWLPLFSSGIKPPFGAVYTKKGFCG